MDVRLLNEESDYLPGYNLLQNTSDLEQDLGLNILFNAMSDGNEHIRSVVRDVIMQFQDNDKTIFYRQAVLKDCMEHESVLHSLYSLANKTLNEKDRNIFSIFATRPSSVLYCSASQLKIFSSSLKELRTIADNEYTNFESKGFIRFWEMIRMELDDNVLSEIDYQLEKIEHKDEIQCSAILGNDNSGDNYILHSVHGNKLNWWHLFFTSLRAIIRKSKNDAHTESYTFHINPRDESGMRSLNHITDQILDPLANVMAQATDYLTDFFQILSSELSFYIGAINLWKHLTKLGHACCLPQPVSKSGEEIYNIKGLYDANLALSMGEKIVTNDIEADNKLLTIVTGANRGGKSTFLRSIGIAQILMQSGIFVPASSMQASVRNTLLTHFKRQEDVNMQSGKLDEELKRMDQLVHQIKGRTMILFNESFAATNDREGSAIAFQITKALIEKGVRIFFVTHLADFPHSFYIINDKNILFLRAEREEDTTRSFRILEGKPLDTSYGIDIYKKIFNE